MVVYPRLDFLATASSHSASVSIQSAAARWCFEVSETLPFHVEPERLYLACDVNLRGRNRLGRRWKCSFPIRLLSARLVRQRRFRLPGKRLCPGSRAFL